MKELQTTFNFEARYYKLGEITRETRQIWFTLHGYGQLAQYFIKKFEVLEKRNIVVIAPEGLSRFYLEQLEAGSRKNNRVGATWMTRENRDMDIRNYLTFLDSVYNKEVRDAKAEITVLGFSQGSATASRWVLNGNVKFSRLILWSGIFPPDMNFEAGSDILNRSENYLVYGNKDPFISDERFAEMKMLTQKLGTTVNEVSFDGGHDIDTETLLRFADAPPTE